MKKTYIILLSSLFLFSCGGSDDGVAVAINIAPTVPKLIFPTDNLVCTNFNLEFDWDAATDSNNDAISYTVDISENETFSTVLFTVTTAATTNTFTLEKGTTYFWRVKATDNIGNESAYTATQTFFTEPDVGVNTVPNAPSVVAPTLGERVSGSTLTLDWDATDNDDDVVSYDLYFGDTNPPVLVSENIDVSTFDVMVFANTTYYWRVVVKDSHQNATIGQLWNFRTE